jgi:hypothetical protein
LLFWPKLGEVCHRLSIMKDFGFSTPARKTVAIWPQN